MTHHPDTSIEPPRASAAATWTPATEGTHDAQERARRLASVVRVVTPAGEAVRPYLDPLRIAAHVWRHRSLIRQLTVRDLAARYRGSFLGVLWSLLVPLAMLGVYTFVFSIVFSAHWGTVEGGRGVVALILFAGLIPFNFFSEMIAVAPMLVVGNASYVKRVVFPLEVLPVVKALSALFQGLVSTVVLIAALLVARHGIPLTVLLLPLAWVPLVLLALGVTYALAALGVLVRDVGQAVGVILPFLFFLTPIVYPLEAVPAGFQVVAWMNPLAHVVEDARRTMIFALDPKWRALAINTTLCGLIAFVGFLFFMRSKRHFHDAL